MKGLVTILIFIFAVGFTASACAGEAAPKTQAACEKAGMNWDATAECTKGKMSLPSCVTASAVLGTNSASKR